MNDRTTPPEGIAQPPASYAGRTHYTQLEYEAVLANASIGIAFTRDRKFFLCNPKFAEMFGWKPEELIGQAGEVVYPSKESYEALGRLAVPVLSVGKQLDLDWEVRRKDGATFIARIIAKSISSSDPRRGTVWIVEDVTAARRHGDEVARLLREQEAIFDTASVGIVFVRDRRIVRCNARYEQMYGYAPGELAGKPTSMFYLSEDEYRKVEEAYAQFRSGIPYLGIGTRKRKDGGVIWVRAVGRPIDPGNPHRGSVWTNEDITEQQKASEQLERLLAEQEALLNNVVVGISFARGRQVLRCNRRFEELFGYDPGELAGATTRQFYFTDEEFDQAQKYYEDMDRGTTHSREQWMRRRDGTGFWCRMSGRALQPGDPSKGTVWLFEDITEAKRASEEVRRALAEQEMILDNATVGIAFVRNRQFQRCNGAMERILGYAPGELVGRSTQVVYAAPETYDDAGRESYAQLARGEAYTVERQVRRKDGSLVWCKVVGTAIDPAQPHEGSIWIYDDISESHEARAELERAVAERTAELKAANERLGAEIGDRKQAEERAQHLADHDALTGLPNRRLLEDRLTQALALTQRNRKQTAVMFVDLDRFKAINDSLGHAAGDQVLKEVAQRLVRQLRIGDTVCRVGGDEFVVVLPEAKRSSDAANVAQKIIETLSQPILVADRELAVTPSIGIAVFPDDGRDAESLIRNADAAMYHAKVSGRANYQFFTEQMNQVASRRLALEQDLRRALGKGELVVHYQPIAELAGGAVRAHEALVRWRHPSRGLLAPAEFLQLAEDTGLVIALGEWVLREACRWATFIGADHGVQVSVNLSLRQFNDAKLIDLVRRVLAESGLPPKLLMLEVAETTAMHQTDVAASTFAKLKELGVSLAIDDFGTGYSNLASLRRYQVDLVKIDRTVVADLPADAHAKALAGGIVGLAHALGLQVVAEGVETEAQRDFLAGLGCELAQGFFIGKPVDADAASAGYV